MSKPTQKPPIKSSKQTIIDAIIKEIEQGTTRAKVLAKIGKKWQLSTRTFDRYWKDAQQQHVVKQEAIKAELAKVDTQLAVEARKSSVLTSIEKKILLSKIAMGEIEIKQKRPVWNAAEKKMQLVTVENPPDFPDRLRAIATLNVMDGDIADKTVKVKGDKNNPITVANHSEPDYSKLSIEALQEIINAR